MRKAYAINYDLKTPGRKYGPLYDEIKKSWAWCHFLESTWLIITDESPDQIWDRLRQYVDKNDYMLIIEVINNTQGWLPDKAWDWIEKNITK